MKKPSIAWMVLVLVLLATATLVHSFEDKEHYFNKSLKCVDCDESEYAQYRHEYAKNLKMGAEEQDPKIFGSAKQVTGIKQTSSAIPFSNKDALFTNKYGAEWNVRVNSKSGMPRQMIGSNIAISESNAGSIEPGVREFITNNKEILNIASSDISLVKEDYSPSIYQGKDGIRNIVYQQSYANIPVYSSRIGVTTSDGNIVSVKSNYFPDINIDTQPTIDEEQALGIVGNDLGKNVATPTKPRTSFILGETPKPTSADGSAKPKSVSLVIYPVETADSYEYHLAYMVELNTLHNPLSAWVYFVDANDGQILHKYDKVISSAIDGTVTGTIYPEHTSQTPVTVPFRNETVSASTIGLNNVLYSGMGNNLSNTATTAVPINLTGVTTATFNFSTQYDIELDWDMAYAMISTDGTSFDIISTYTGSQLSWIDESFDITSYAGQDVWIGFAYGADEIIAEEGFYADNVSVNTDIGMLFSDDLENGSANWAFSGFSLTNEIIPITSTTTDTTGYYNVSDLTGDTTIFSKYSGPYVIVGNFAQQSSSVTNTLTPPATYDWNWSIIDTSNMQEESNVFYHVNVMHDYFTKGAPFNISEMDYQMLAAVEDSGTCNAFADGIDIYFSGAGGGCNATSLLSDVIYHEYTHNVVEQVYTVSPPYSGESGALNEGWGDYFASTVNDNPCTAEGFYIGSGCLRNISNINRYPDDIVGEVHDDSLIVSGAMWDTRVLLGADIADSLMIMAMKLEPLTFQEYVEAVLIVDDDNGDLNDGTPHINEIFEAFYVNHGIYTPYFIDLMPDISVTPAEVYSAMYPNNTSSVDVVIENMGGIALNWDAYIPTGDNYTMFEPAYEWVDGVTGGTNLGLLDDDYSTETLPFNFIYYAAEFDQIHIGSNGYVSFSYDTPDWFIDIPSTDLDAQYGISPLGDDWDPESGGTVYVKSLANPNRYVVTWNQVPEYGTGGSNTFQMVLFENGQIRFNYNNIETASGSTVGLNYGDGILYNVYPATPVNGMSLSFIPPSVDWVSVTPDNGTTSSGASSVFTLSFNTTDIDVGSYVSAVVIESDDPDESMVNIPISIDVVDPTPLEIDLVSPVPQIYNSKNVELQYNVNKRIQGIGYSLDGGGNINLSGNITLMNLSNGAHEVIVSAQDLMGIWNSTTVAFTVEAPEIWVTPSELIFEMYQGDTASKNATIGNSGVGPLEWNAEIYSPTVINYTMFEPAYEWVGGVIGGTDLGLGGHGYSTQTLPFNFTYYGMEFEQVYIGSSGYVSFYDNNPDDVSNDPIPSTDVDNQYLIAPLWDHWHPEISGGVYVKSLTNPNRYVVTWDQVPEWSAGGSNTFQMILFESGQIRFNYNNIETTGTTVGLNYGNGILYNVYPSTPVNGMSLSFAPYVDWASVTPDNGTTAPGTDENVSVEVNSTDMEFGRYSAEISVESNDVDNTPYELPVTVYVFNASDVIPPVIIIESPQDGMLYHDSALLLNFTINEEVVDILYSLNGAANITISGNTTFDISNGNHALTVYARDLGGNWNQSTTTFEVQAPDIWISPESFNIGMNSNMTKDMNLIIGNDGNYTLDWDTSTSVYAASLDRILIIGDGFSENNVYTVLTDAGMDVTVAGVMENTWDGTNPSPYDYNAIVLLDGQNYWMDMNPAGQTVLVDYVNNGGGLVLGEWATYGIFDFNGYSNMRDLILLEWNVWDYLEDSETYTVVASHPITANLPTSFMMPNNAHTYGVARPGATTLITGTSSNDAVVVKEIGSGRVVEYAWANNYMGITIWTPELEQLFVDSVNWAGNTNFITVTPESGSTPIANQTDVTVTADSDNVSEGTYSGSITITSNDLDESPIVVPVTVTVDDTNPVVSFESPTPVNDSVLAAGTGTVTINVSVTESNPDTLILNWNGVNESHAYGSEWSITKDVGDSASYTYYVLVNDTADNVNMTEMRTLSISSGGTGGTGGTGGGSNTGGTLSISSSKTQANAPVDGGSDGNNDGDGDTASDTKGSKDSDGKSLAASNTPEGDETTFQTGEPDASKGSGSTAALVALSLAGVGVAGVAWNRRKG